MKNLSFIYILRLLIWHNVITYSINFIKPSFSIPNKKNGKLRPLGIPSFDDKLVQEIVRMLLEAIYEPTFSNYSHGFRPNRSCHTALLQLQWNFSGGRWFIEGDIKSFFDNINRIWFEQKQ